MNLSERRAAVDSCKGKTIVLTLVSGLRLAYGIQGTDENNAICIPKRFLQDAYEKKLPIEEIFSDVKNYEYIPLLDISEISDF